MVPNIAIWIQNFWSLQKIFCVKDEGGVLLTPVTSLLWSDSISDEGGVSLTPVPSTLWSDSISDEGGVSCTPVPSTLWSDSISDGVDVLSSLVQSASTICSPPLDIAEGF